MHMFQCHNFHDMWFYPAVIAEFNTNRSMFCYGKSIWMYGFHTEQNNSIPLLTYGA